MKFNGFENWILTEALKNWTEMAEAEIDEKQNTLFAKGYFNMVQKDIKTKLDDNTKKDKHANSDKNA